MATLSRAAVAGLLVADGPIGSLPRRRGLKEPHPAQTDPCTDEEAGQQGDAARVIGLRFGRGA